MRIAIIGSGYVGLVPGACFADFGHAIARVDDDPHKVTMLRRNEVPIFEPGLADLVAYNVSAGRLSFTTDLAAATAAAEVVMIAVGTPSRRGDGHADLFYVYSAAREIAPALDGPSVAVTKSTVPVGTGEEVERIIREARPDVDLSVASNPEFLREGTAIEDFKRPDRIVLGREDSRARAAMQELYRLLYLNQAPIIWTSRRTAELTKYAATAFLASKIVFVNEIADLCEKVDADVQEIACRVGLDDCIGPKFLHAGPGYGGSCFPKDTLALIKTGHDHGASQRIVETVVAVNGQRKRSMAEKVVATCGGNLRGRPVGVMGLTSEPNTDDMRGTPSLSLITALQDGGAHVRAYDHAGIASTRRMLDDVAFASDPYGCADGSDALAIVTEWDAFRALDLGRRAYRSAHADARAGRSARHPPAGGGGPPWVRPGRRRPAGLNPPHVNPRPVQF